MINELTRKQFWLSLVVVLVLGLIMTGCGNRPTPPQSVSAASDTPTPPPPTSTPEPTSTTEPTPTLTPEPTSTPEPTPLSPMAVASDGDTNVRTGPGTEYPKDGMLLEGGALEIIGRNAESTWWQVATANGPRWLSAEVTTVENVTGDVPLADGQAVAAAPTATEVPPTPTTVPPTATPTPEPEVVVEAEVETDETTADSEAEVEADPDDSEVDQEEAATADEAEPENSAEEEVAATDPESESETVETQASQTAAETCRAISLLAPTAGQSTNNPALEVRWQCDGALGENYGFEVRLWRAGGTPVGAHDAVNGQSYINHDGNTYSLTIPIEDLSIFEGKNKTYQVAVAVVQIAPAYQDLGNTSDAVEFLFE